MTKQALHLRLLHPQVLRWIHKQGWTDLRKVQKDAISEFFQSEQDLIISSPTASGKTEAALFPILSCLVGACEGSVRLLWISPLKALINDSYQRFELICDSLGIPVHRWHGDVSASKKKKLLERPNGILLITPESLEALFMRRHGELTALFQFLQWLVIDELHVFLATERGRQLLSLLYRLEWAIGKRPRRIGLSATLGEQEKATLIMSQGNPCKFVDGSDTGSSGSLLLQLNVVLEPQNSDPNLPESNSSINQISKSLFKNLRGKNHLVFANSRQNVELLANALRVQSEKEKVPREFFPHHGNLSKDFREDVESRLKKGNLPHTAICTSTLELGIDIGHVHSIAQIGIPPSAASLRQRLGRSGRRSGTPILRVYLMENQVVASIDCIRPQLFQMVAMIELILDRWNEPPEDNAYCFSTLVHQILSIIYQYGGISISDLFHLLCKPKAAFNSVEQEDFLLLLRHLKQSDIIQQLTDGTLLLATKGERITEHYSFFSVFPTTEEYRLEANGKLLGSIPVSNSLFIKKFIVFAGKTWQIVEIKESQKLILLTPSPGGTPPRFDSNGIWIHGSIREKMKLLYSAAQPEYLTKTARAIFEEGQRYFHAHELEKKFFWELGNSTVFLPWVGDKIMNTLTLILSQIAKVTWSGPALIFENLSTPEVMRKIDNLLEEFPKDPLRIAETIENKIRNKFDHLVPTPLLVKALAKKEVDLKGAKLVLENCK